MIPQEKAKELVNKFRHETDGIAGYNYDSVNIKCALIAVDEIINSNFNEDFNGHFTDLYDAVSYWKEVKEEIEKL